MTSVALGLPAMRRSDPVQAKISARPQHTGLVDRFGRVASDLRISLTDRCNLRCTYCMPTEGLDWLPRHDVLTGAEIVRLARIAVTELGVSAIRLTGGEPLLRRDLLHIVSRLASLRTSQQQPVPIAMTTNGIGLDAHACALAKAGLTRLNVSLDTLDSQRFRQLAHRDRLGDVLAGLAAAAGTSLHPIKINAVLMPQINRDEAPRLLRWALRGGFELRFIEQMPLDAQGEWDRSAMVTAEDILADLVPHFELRPASAPRGAAPAELWDVAAGEGHPDGRVGIIAAVTRPFCADCDRTRLTAEGMLRNCLFAHDETDLRTLLRGGASDAELAQMWRATMWRKRAGHGIDDPQFTQPARPMSAIGG